MDRKKFDALLADSLDELEAQGVELEGLVLVAFGSSQDGLRSKVAAVVDDENQLPFAFAYAASLCTAAALPPEAVPGFARRTEQA